MNENLRFSWGHIIAFLALIIICYMTFVGVVYDTGGDFQTAGGVTAIFAFVLLLFFIGAQTLKATPRKFARCIWPERFLVFGSPVVFAVCMLPYFHFCSVHSQSDAIIGNFKSAISSSKQMFADYDAYADERIENYTKLLNRMAAGHSESAAFGFTAGNERIQRENMLNTLRMALLPDDYSKLKSDALSWIDKSSNGASTWNVFLMGNTREIKAAIHAWNDQLAELASRKVANEEFRGLNKVESFQRSSSSLADVDKSLDQLTEQFTKSATPSVLSMIVAVIIAILLYVMLLLPYIIQERYTKSTYRLIGRKNGSSDVYDSEMSFSSDSSDGASGKSGKNASRQSAGSSDDYESFTMD